MIRSLCAFGASLLVALGPAPAGSAPASPASPASAYSWPLSPGPDRIVGDFDPPAQPWLAGNRGLDLAGHRGQAVHTANSGIVTFAGPVGGTGAVAITFGSLRTTYEPVTPSVRRGERVEAGQVIGHLDADQLHWGLLRGTDYLDPLALLGLLRVRLLPLPSRG
ncbi:MAG TPA: peptidoglycan DD-metalloendopeptidase family protein [Mycobacteriales bacterium]|nr:peptidoglycan DD-metalloendopeptidase family protein [Mycobacteriales bacterium]